MRLPPRWRTGIVRGVTRHQLLVDPRMPYTSHNSCNVVHLRIDRDVDLVALADAVQLVMLADLQPGSDPGLCVAQTVSPGMIVWDSGLRWKCVPWRKREYWQNGPGANCAVSVARRTA